MIEKLSLKPLILVLIAVVLFWAILGGRGVDKTGDDLSGDSDSVQLVSAIQALSDAAAGENNGVISGSFSQIPRPELTEEQNSDLNELFKQALSSESDERAIGLYNDLIEKYPSSIEPHLNLASLYADNGSLEKARETLLHGFEQNPKARLLFRSLQGVHGALAATAYSKALDTKSNVSQKVSLPKATSLVTRLDQQAQIATLKKQISSLGEIQSNQNQADNNAQVISALKNELSLLKNELSQVKLSHAEELTGLNSELTNAKQSLLSSQAAERESIARVARVEQEADLQLSKAKALAMKVAQQKNAEKVDDLNEQLASMQARLVAASAAVSAANTSRITASTDTSFNESVAPQVNQNLAIGLVQSWARSWSAQDVDAYVAHYADNYTSGYSVTRKQWLVQRQHRLSNKKFIKVRVSGFIVKDLDGQFSVTFSQSYKSNTVDDTVKKRLIFNKQGGSWTNAKIVNESIVSR